VTAEPHSFALGAFSFADGTTLNDAQLVYTTYGTLNNARDNVIVWPTWFTGTHLDHEWMVGDGEALDTREYFVVIPGMFGNGLSSSPTNTPPPFDRARFPSPHDPGQPPRAAPSAGRALRRAENPARHRWIDGRISGFPVGAQPSKARRAHHALLWSVAGQPAPLRVA
jgi:hypothetical protein